MSCNYSPAFQNLTHAYAIRTRLSNSHPRNQPKSLGTRLHRDLHPDMLQLVTPPDATAYLIYTEPGLKNRQGGLNERKVTNKSVKCFANDADPSRYCI